MPATNTEQLLMELINRARLDPLAEAERYAIDLNEDLNPGQLDGLPVQPLSGNEFLLTAANAHSTWMLDNDTFSHTGVDGSNAGARASSAGYVFAGSWTRGENIAFTGNTQSINPVTAIYSQHEGLFLSSGHRLNILNGAFRELGAGQQLGEYTSGQTIYQASMVSQTFAASGSAYYLTGVVYNESSGDDFYSVGEGQAGVTFQIGANSASSQAAGGYSLTYSGGAGDVTVTVTIGAETSTVTLGFQAQNFKLDVVDGDTFLSSGDITLQAGISNVRLLGAVAAAATGTDAANILIGSRGDNRLSGLDGNDTLRGGDGRDILYGGAGDDFIFGGETSADLHDVIYGGDGNDSIAGGFGADTVIGGAGDDVLTGSAFSDLIFGGEGNDFVNGGFGHDRVNGGTGADRFFHLGIFDHGSDWVQDYNAADGDVLVWGGAAATEADFQINTADTASAGAAGVAESFVIYRPTGQIIWALVDGDAQNEINIQIAGQLFDLMA